LEALVDTAIRALSAVAVNSSLDCVPSVKKANDEGRAIGLGQMNLHGFFGRELMHYGDDESLDFTNIYFSMIAFYALKASNKIAIETKAPFEGFEKSKYASGEFFDKYINESWKWTPKFDKTVRLLGRHRIPTVADWIELKRSIQTHGLFNSYLQAVPPTGSISYINDATSSIHPIAQRVENRKEGKTGRVFYPAPGMTNDNTEYFKDAFEIGPEKVIDVYAAATQHVDQGLSLTLFYKSTATTRDVNKAQIYAWTKGIKTMYYIRTRQESLDATVDTDINSCTACAL
jgi:ribonucleoside-diphosphate reductase alpha chain